MLLAKLQKGKRASDKEDSPYRHYKIVMSIYHAAFIVVSLSSLEMVKPKGVLSKYNIMQIGRK